MNEDWQRLNWIAEAIAEGVDIRIEKKSDLVDVWVGQVQVPGFNLREALDIAMGLPLPRQRKYPLSPHF